MHFDNFAEIDFPAADFQLSECCLVAEVHEMKKELETIRLIFDGHVRLVHVLVRLSSFRLLVSVHLFVLPLYVVAPVFVLPLSVVIRLFVLPLYIVAPVFVLPLSVVVGQSFASFSCLFSGASL
jgi:hypothetical protein